LFVKCKWLLDFRVFRGGFKNFGFASKACRFSLIVNHPPKDSPEKIFRVSFVEVLVFILVLSILGAFSSPIQAFLSFYDCCGLKKANTFLQFWAGFVGFTCMLAMAFNLVSQFSPTTKARSFCMM